MPLLSPQKLARTYNPPNTADPWKRVELYRESQRYPDNWGSRKVARRMGVSRGEISRWVDGDSKPDAAHAVDFARDQGWFADTWTPTLCALGELVISIYAFGSIERESLLPSWARTQADNEAVVEDALERVGTGFVHIDNGDETPQIRPKTHASVLGRSLSIAGAPVGHKNAESVTGLPEWINNAPSDVRETAAKLLVRGRGYESDRRDTRFIKTRRGPQYFEDVSALVEDVSGKPAPVKDHGVTISADAVRALGLA